MKSAIFAVVLLTLGLLSLPVLAQQQDLQDVMNAANARSAGKRVTGQERRGGQSIALHIGWIVGDASPAVRI
jgi:hypothetical protein